MSNFLEGLGFISQFFYSLVLWIGCFIIYKTFRFNWLSFRFRFLAVGTLIGSSLFIQTLICSQSVDEHDFILFFSCIFFLNIFIGICGREFYNLLKKDTLFIMIHEEEIKAHDAATIRISGFDRSGRIILTTKRLTFIAHHPGRTQHDFYFGKDSNINVVYKWFLPFGISFTGIDAKINVRFPLYWYNRIDNQINFTKNRKN